MTKTREAMRVLLALCALMGTGCHESKEGPAGSKPADASAAVAVTPTPPPTGPGSIQGEVLFNGQVPPPEPLKGAAAKCAGAPSVDEVIAVKGGRLENVLVRISTNAPPAPAPTACACSTRRSAW